MKVRPIRMSLEHRLVYWWTGHHNYYRNVVPYVWMMTSFMVVYLAGLLYGAFLLLR